MPPVLHVAFDELSRRCEQDVCAADIRTGVDQGEDVLQLISEPERAARLIRSRPCPDPAAQRLVGQPAVDDEIEGIIRRAHADGAEHVVPGPSGRSERLRRRGKRLVTRDQFARLRHVAPLAKHEGDLPGFVRREFNDDLECRARVQTRAASTGQPRTQERRRPGKRPIASDELRTVSGMRLQRFGRTQKGHATREVGVVRIARDDRLSVRRELGRHEAPFAHPRRTEAPFDIAKYAQPPAD